MSKTFKCLFCGCEQDDKKIIKPSIEAKRYKQIKAEVQEKLKKIDSNGGSEEVKEEKTEKNVDDGLEAEEKEERNITFF